MDAIMMENFTQDVNFNMTFNNITNISGIECCFDDAEEESGGLEIPDFPFNLSRSIILAFRYVLLCASLFLNTLLLLGISPVSTSVLKAKKLIQNSSVTNILFGITVACDPFFIAALTGNVETPPHLCFRATYASGINIWVYVQAICVMGLAADRVFATTFPLSYGTTGYGKKAEVILLFLPWIIALGLYMVFIFITWPSLPDQPIPGIPMFCLHMITAFVLAEGTNMLDGFLFTLNVLSFLAYIAIFVGIAIKDRALKSMAKTTTTKRANLALAKTYFLINLTTLALYLPAPLYSFFSENAMDTDVTPESTNISSGLFLLYVSNTWLDPLILISRVRSIRRNLPIVYKDQNSLRAKPSIGSISQSKSKY